MVAIFSTGEDRWAVRLFGEVFRLRARTYKEALEEAHLLADRLDQQQYEDHYE